MALSDKTKQVSGWRTQLGQSWQTIKQIIRPVRPAQRAGMGAVPHDNGVIFRVWAPHATAVFVIGTFNNWQHGQTPLASEGNGLWSANVPQAQLGDGYKFVIQNGKQQLLRTDPYAKEVRAPYHDSLVRNGFVAGVDTTALASPISLSTTAVSSSAQTVPTQPATFQPPALHELVIYELHVGTFGDEEGNPPYDFEAVIKKLPYLRVLGINAIELMPVKAFPGELSWGYNPNHPFAISQIYGGPEALKQLVQAAHAQGIAVIVDVVYNHFGPGELSLWQFDGWQQHGLGGIYFYNDWRSKTPWADTRPDYGRPQVRQYIRDNVRMWLEEYQIDGLRWDATSYIRNAHGHDSDPGADIAEGWALMQGINGEMAHRNPRHIRIAEDLQANKWLTEPIEAGGAGFNSQWDSQFVHPIREAIIAPRDEDRDMLAVRDALQFRYGADVFSRVIYTESHDEVANGKARVVHEVTIADGSDVLAASRAALGAALVFTAPGVPMLFQGQEFLEDGWFDDKRSLDWQKATQNSGMVTLYRHLIALRRNLQGKTRGLSGQSINVFHVNDAAKLIAFHRWHFGGPGDDVIVVVNFANRMLTDYKLGFPRGGAWQVRLNSDLKAYHPSFSSHHVGTVTAVPGEYDQLAYQATLSIGPYSVLILSQDGRS
ncbi:alpha-amylase family glycosyl hydrolase [Candidatus Leptofilum sp.]|uniref:alpha-amylase family glycosyl hydrolase n=1 Tax=Candidatus Leptofilum sp. TaxID=3241576 RepID=UPI003B58CE4B